jgi:hypothetical protein
MDWLFSFFEKALEGVGVLIGSGIGAAGEKVGTSLPAVRPMDKIATARRMSRDQTELYNLYNRLLSYTDQAQDTCNTVCWGAVVSALDPTPDDLTNPFVLAANRLCQHILHYERYYPLPEIDLTRQLPLGEIWELTALTRRCLAFYETGYPPKPGQFIVDRVL